MWFIVVEVEQESSAPPPKKKFWIRPWFCSLTKLIVLLKHTYFTCMSIVKIFVTIFFLGVAIPLREFSRI